MIPSDRANPQVGGLDRIPGRVVDVMVNDGFQRFSGIVRTHKLVVLPVEETPQGRAGASYNVAAHIAAASAAGPAGFYARLRGANRRAGE